MKALITGINGTVGSALQAFLNRKGIETIGWDRSRVPVDQYHRMEQFVRETSPDYFFHLAIASKPTGLENEGWRINYDWPGELAWITRLLKIPFVVTSTAMVFKDDTPPPLTVETPPNAESGYGYEKRRMEERVVYQNPDTRIVRLGWQIGRQSGTNNMVDFLENKQKTEGRIEASTRWYPACSLLEDTAEALFSIASNQPPGLYMADSNLKWNFYEIVCALKQKLKKDWNVVPVDHFSFDQRLIDPRVPIRNLKERLTDLP